jgi:hypothetical protein
MAIENKLSTWTDELAERGIDLADHLERMQAEQKLAAAYGQELVIAPKKEIQPGANDPNAANPDQAEEKPAAKAAAGRELTNGHDLEQLVN